MPLGQLRFLSPRQRCTDFSCSRSFYCLSLTLQGAKAEPLSPQNKATGASDHGIKTLYTT